MYAIFDLSLQALKGREIRAMEEHDVRHATSARDAMQLLNTFAFMHREGIRYDFLKRCVEVTSAEQAFAKAEKQRVSSMALRWSD